MSFSLDDLRRWPDFEAPELRAWDAADTLILDEARPLLASAAVTVIGDDYGALTLGALADGADRVRVHQDSLAGELALEAKERATTNPCRSRQSWSREPRSCCCACRGRWMPSTRSPRSSRITRRPTWS